jgi:hypothetical protein
VKLDVRKQLRSVVLMVRSERREFFSEVWTATKLMPTLWTYGPWLQESRGWPSPPSITSFQGS